MKKAKAPSAKTLARKAKEAAMIAWAKQQQAKFRADLREMFAREKRERLGIRDESVGTGNTTKRLVLQAPELENKPRLSDLLLGDAEKKADGILAQLRRSREQEIARAKAMARADAVRREKMKEFEERKKREKPVAGLGGKTESAVSPAAMRYIDSMGTVRGRLGKDFTRAVVPGKEDFPQWWLDGKIPPEKDSRTSRVNKAVEQKKQQEKNNDRFEKFAKEALNFEGGYVNNKNDKGGPTNRGISWKTWGDTAKKYLNVEPTLENLKNLTVEGAKKIYKADYFDYNKIDRIGNDRVAFMVFDWCINSGPIAISELQILLNSNYRTGLKTDGRMGTKTIEAINRISDQHKLLLDIAECRRNFCEMIARKNPSQKEFKKGWLRRIDECLNEKF